MTKFPSPTGVNYYEYGYAKKFDSLEEAKFPSPTGVNYYECTFTGYRRQGSKTSFRPQQGLTIMNLFSEFQMI